MAKPTSGGRRHVARRTGMAAPDLARECFFAA